MHIIPSDKEICFPCAKINIGLIVASKRPDGYHNLQTLFYPIDYRDVLEVVPIDKPGQCEFTATGIPIDGDPNDNLVVKAYRKLENRFNGLPGVSIHLEKQIPFGAGLGGGSSDAACMLKLLAKLYDLNPSQWEMEEEARSLGADCAFFCREGAQYCEGIGYELSPFDISLKGKYIVIVKPPFGVSTKEAYASVKPCEPKHSLKELLSQPIEKWKDTIVNDFEASVFPLHPELAEIKQRLYNEGAVYASMSGSGSAMFGIFNTRPEHCESWFGEDYICRCLEAFV